jgi:hypothetical protein
MKNTEIRIGNYVYRNDILVTVDEQTFWDMKNNPEQYKPIKLEEHWFKYFGAIKFDATDWVLKMGGLQFYCRYNKKCYSSIEGSYLSDRIEFVHQLQNLYFALTNQELKA